MTGQETSLRFQIYPLQFVDTHSLRNHNRQKKKITQRIQFRLPFIYYHQSVSFETNHLVDITHKKLEIE